MSRFRKGVSLLVGAGKESSLLRGSVSLLSQNAVVYGISFISSILLARWLGPVQLGLFYVASLLPNYAEKFGRVGLIDHATVYYIGKKKYGPGMAAGHLTVLFLLSSSLVILGYALFKDQFQDAFLKTRALPSYYVWTAVASIPALLLIVGYGKIQLALGLIRSYNASQVMRPLLFLIMGLVFWFFQWDFYGAILAAAVSVWAAVLIAGVSLWRVESFSFKPNLSFVIDVFKFGWGMYTITLLQFLQERFDLLVIALYLTKAEISFYSLAVGISLLLIKLPATMSTLFYSRVTRQNEGEASAYTARICRINFLICCVAAAALVLAAYPAVFLFFGDRYLGLIMPLIILVPGTVFLGQSRLLTEYFYGIGRPRRLISPGIITTGFNIALNLLLTPRFGIKAAAFISSCTYTLSFMLLAFRFSRASGVPVRALLLTSRDEIRQTLRAVFPAKPL